MPVVVMGASGDAEDLLKPHFGFVPILAKNRAIVIGLFHLKL